METAATILDITLLSALLSLASHLVTLHQAPIARDMVAPNGTEARNVTAPVSVELSSNSSPVEQLAASSSHALVGRLLRVLSKGSRAVSSNEDIVALLDQTKGR